MERSERRAVLGNNIRQARKRRHMSADQLAEKLEQKTGEKWATSAVLKCERGERSVQALELLDFAACIGCDLQTLLYGIDNRQTDRNLSDGMEFRKLTDSEAKILRRIATDWDGDIHALLIFTGLYAALPPKYRREAPLSLLTMMDRALRDGAITEDDLPEEIDYMEQQWRLLYK